MKLFRRCLMALVLPFGACSSGDGNPEDGGVPDLGRDSGEVDAQAEDFGVPEDGAGPLCVDGQPCIPFPSGCVSGAVRCTSSHEGRCEPRLTEPAPAGHVCRPAASECDVAETCDGVSVGCPPNALREGFPECGEAGVCFLGTCADCEEGSDCAATRELFAEDRWTRDLECDGPPIDLEELNALFDRGSSHLVVAPYATEYTRTCAPLTGCTEWQTEDLGAPADLLLGYNSGGSLTAWSRSALSGGFLRSSAIRVLDGDILVGPDTGLNTRRYLFTRDPLGDVCVSFVTVTEVDADGQESSRIGQITLREGMSGSEPSMAPEFAAGTPCRSAEPDLSRIAAAWFETGSSEANLAGNHSCGELTRECHPFTGCGPWLEGPRCAVSVRAMTILDETTIEVDFSVSRLPWTDSTLLDSGRFEAGISSWGGVAVKGAVDESCIGIEASYELSNTSTFGVGSVDEWALYRNLSKP